MAGYQGWSKSNNAIAAEADGMVTRGKITKEWLTDNGITEKAGFIKWLISVNYIQASEWHHTSMFYNETDFFSGEEISADLERIDQRDGLDRLRAIYAGPDRPKTQIKTWWAIMEMKEQA